MIGPTAIRLSRPRARPRRAPHRRARGAGSVRRARRATSFAWGARRTRRRARRRRPPPAPSRRRGRARAETGTCPIRGMPPRATSPTLRRSCSRWRTTTRSPRRRCPRRLRLGPLRPRRPSLVSARTARATRAPRRTTRATTRNPRARRAPLPSADDAPHPRATPKLPRRPAICAAPTPSSTPGRRPPTAPTPNPIPKRLLRGPPPGASTPPPPVPSDPPGSSARSAAPRAARGFPSIPPRTKWSAPSA